LRRNAGTTSDWELYLPTGSTDFRFFTGGGDAYTFGATGNLQLTQLNGVAPSDFARLSQQNTFTGQIQGLAAASPLLNINDTSGADKSLVRFQDNGVTRGYVGSANVASGCIVGDAQGDVCVRAVSGAVRVSGDDGATTHFAVSSTAITGTSGVDMTPSSGTFTVNYDNCCTTTITQSVRWYKIGSVVTMTAAAATSGTGDTTVFDSTVDIPAAIRPSTSNAYSAGFGANNNGASVTAMVEIATNGEIIVNRCGAVTGTCDGGAWTGSGARGLDAWTVSYVQ
jgi:hypothetical protein